MNSIKKFLFTTFSDITRIIISKKFYVAIFFTVVVFCICTIHKSDKGKEYSVITSFIQLSAQERANNEEDFCRENVINSASSNRLDLFASVITLIPIISIIASERKRDSGRFALFRVGVKPYILSKVITTIIIGGEVISLGYIVFNGAAYLIYPSNEKCLNEINIMNELIGYIPFWKIVLQYFLFGSATALVGLLFVSITTNEYLVYSLPFIFVYMINMFSLNILNKINDYESIKYKLVLATNPETLLHLFSYDKVQCKCCIAVLLLLVVVSIASWGISFRIKYDLGKN